MPPPPWAEIRHDCKDQKLKRGKDEKVDDRNNWNLSEKQQFETCCCSFQSVKKGNEPNEYENFAETDDEEDSPKSLKKKVERQDDDEYVDRDETTADEESIMSGSDDISSEPPTRDDDEEFVHMWVVIRKGPRDIKSTLCIDACTGNIFETRNCPFLKVEAIANHKQFWINVQGSEKKAR